MSGAHVLLSIISEIRMVLSGIRSRCCRIHPERSKDGAPSTFAQLGL
jgi:hypothetical protein